MRDNAKNRSKEVSRRIKKARKSLESLEGSEITQTIQAELVDIIPLGRFPDENGNHSEDN